MDLMSPYNLISGLEYGKIINCPGGPTSISILPWTVTVYTPPPLSFYILFNI